MNTGLEIDGYPIVKLNGYFDKRAYYVEEFDTSDGRHWIVTYPPETWTPEIKHLAKQQGIYRW